MKDTPILFSGPMVRAILAGTKTQTRRLVRGLTHESQNVRLLPGSYIKCDSESADRVSDRIKSPYGWAGDRLWVRETWRRSGGVLSPDVLFAAELNDYTRKEKGPWKPGIHLRRVDARLFLGIASVHVERIHDIAADDVRAEGVTREMAAEMIDLPVAMVPDERAAFRILWTAINGKRAPWESNPWVWAVTFKRVPS